MLVIILIIAIKDEIYHFSDSWRTIGEDSLSRRETPENRRVSSETGLHPWNKRSYSLIQVCDHWNYRLPSCLSHDVCRKNFFNVAQSRATHDVSRARLISRCSLAQIAIDKGGRGGGSNIFAETQRNTRYDTNTVTSGVMLNRRRHFGAVCHGRKSRLFDLRENQRYIMCSP